MTNELGVDEFGREEIHARYQQQPQDLDQMQPPMRGGNRDTSRLACAAHLRHSIEFAQHEIAYWEAVVKQLTLAAEDMERK